MRLFEHSFLSVINLCIDECTHIDICYEGVYLLTFLWDRNVTVELFLNRLSCSFLRKISGPLSYYSLAVSYWSNIGPNKTLTRSVNSMSLYAVLNTKLTLEHWYSICFYRKTFVQVGSSSDIVQIIFEIH